MPTTSNGRDCPWGGLGSSSLRVLPTLANSCVSRDSRPWLLAFCTLRYQSIISASVLTCKSVTLLPTLLPGCRDCTFSSGSTLRSVTGNSAKVGLPGSAKRSTTPKLLAANLASGGCPPVLVSNGKDAAFCSVRPEASTNPFGSTIW